MMVVLFPQPPKEVPNAFSQPNTEPMVLKDLKSWIKLTVGVKVYQI